MFFSATLQASEVRRLVADITEFPTWIDLKGGINVPDVRVRTRSRRHGAHGIPMLALTPKRTHTYTYILTHTYTYIRTCMALWQTVHHVVRMMDPLDWAGHARARAVCTSSVQTDGIHARGRRRQPPNRHTYMHTYMHTRIHTHTYIHTHTHTYIHTHMHTHTPSCRPSDLAWCIMVVCTRPPARVCARPWGPAGVDGSSGWGT
jgi:hypothetical protein